MSFRTLYGKWCRYYLQSVVAQSPMGVTYRAFSCWQRRKRIYWQRFAVVACDYDREADVRSDIEASIASAPRSMRLVETITDGTHVFFVVEATRPKEWKRDDTSSVSLEIPDVQPQEEVAGSEEEVAENQEPEKTAEEESPALEEEAPVAQEPVVEEISDEPEMQERTLLSRKAVNMIIVGALFVVIAVLLAVRCNMTSPDEAVPDIDTTQVVE